MTIDIEHWVESNRDRFIDISDRIWNYSELGLFEEKSSGLQARILEEAGFEVAKGVADMPTAIMASYGSEGPVIGILGEFDALPGLSQAVEPVKKPVTPGAPGHGCGHNLLGAASMAASMVVKEKIERGELKGSIRYYGCPGEENANGKEWMIKAGVFDDVDASLTWHPEDVNSVVSVNFQAIFDVVFRFHGRSAHAASDPFNGRSALDAVELMNVGCNYLREHIIPDACLHYAITNGGEAPNIVPAEAEVWYFVRAPRLKQAREVYSRVIKVAEGAAMMTDTSVETILLGGTSNMLPNITLENLLHEKMKQVGAPAFDEAELEFARGIRGTLESDFFDNFLLIHPDDARERLEGFRDKEFCDEILPIHGRDSVIGGSTDVGGVSWATPLAQFMSACWAIGTPGHSWQLTAQAGSAIGRRGMLQAAKVLGLAAAELMENPELVKQAREEFEGKTRAAPYRSPLEGDISKVFEYYKKLYEL